LPKLEAFFRTARHRLRAAAVSAGATSPQLQTEADMIKTTLPQERDGRTPVQWTTFYKPIRVLETAPATNEAEPPSNKSKVLEDNLATA